MLRGRKFGLLSGAASTLSGSMPRFVSSTRFATGRSARRSMAGSNAADRRHRYTEGRPPRRVGEPLLEGRPTFPPGPNGVATLRVPQNGCEGEEAGIDRRI